MSKDMKLIMENWRGNVLQEQSIRTVGDLKKVINSHRLSQAGKETGKLAVDTFVEEIPVLGTAFRLFGASKDSKEILRKLYSAEDNFKTNTGLDKLNIDDNVSKIVDDEIENAFLKALMDMLNDMDDLEEIPDVNVALQNFLKRKFNQHSVEAK